MIIIDTNNRAEGEALELRTAFITDRETKFPPFNQIKISEKSQIAAVAVPGSKPGAWDRMVFYMDADKSKPIQLAVFSGDSKSGKLLLLSSTSPM